MKPADVTCPVCRMRWTTETSRSWWHWSDRCYGCQEPHPSDHSGPEELDA